MLGADTGAETQPRPPEAHSAAFLRSCSTVTSKTWAQLPVLQETLFKDNVLKKNITPRTDMEFLPGNTGFIIISKQGLLLLEFTLQSLLP